MVLDPYFKMQFVKFSYMKLHESCNIETIHVHEKLFSLFNEYVRNSLTPKKSSSGKDIGTIEYTRAWVRAKWSRDTLKVMLCFSFKIKSINYSCLILNLFIVNSFVLFL